jgi:hypothetical protein
VVGAKGLPAAVTVELIAAGAEEFAAIGIGARPHFENGAAAVLAEFQGKAFKKRLAIGAFS